MANAAGIVATLKRDEAALRSRGVVRLGLFGSVARGDESLDSDVDVLIAIDPNIRLGLLKMVELRRHLTETLGHPVDIAEYDCLKGELRDEALRDEIRVF